MSWIKEALTFGREKKMDKKKDKEMPEPPLPPPEFKAAVVLSEEELKYVPELDKTIYMSVKEKNPELAAQWLATFKAKHVEEPAKFQQQNVQLITENQLINMKLDMILEKLA